MKHRKSGAFFVDKSAVTGYFYKNIFMRITIIGTGYVGLVNGACMAYKGADVTCIDVDERKIDGLKNGIIPIYEENLENIIKESVKEGRLHFSTDYSSVNSSDIVFICVGTPENSDGSANLDYIFGAVRNFIGSIHGEHKCVLTVKSTVPVGTTHMVRDMIQDVLGKRHNISVAFNPEFLKEGFAVSDCMNPDRVVLGLEDGGKQMTFELIELKRLYGVIMGVSEDKIVSTDIRSAEMVKYASNAMLATRISFINEIANLCEAVGANIDDVSKCVGMDSRIGPKFLKAGCGYGGSCFPKDVNALMKTADENNQAMLVLRAVDTANMIQKERLYRKYLEFFENEPAKKACVLGLAFKPGTDDMREAPSINLIEDLLSEGVEVVACDPVAVENAKKIFGDRIKYETDPYAAVDGAGVVFLVTEWNEFKTLDLNRVKGLMKYGDVFIDGRNVYNRSEMEKLGFKYDRIG